MARKALILCSFSLLFAAESVYFVRQSVASVLRLHGEQALFKNDHQRSWRNYKQALAWGGDVERLETDIIEMLLFGLDQSEAGIKIRPALDTPDALGMLFTLVARRIQEAPHKAYYWSLASDIYLDDVRQRRRRSPLDLSRLSEDPLENLQPEEWLGVAALERASQLEPNNYLYHDLLTEFFLEIGSSEKAAEYCRRAVAAYPVMADHMYLLRDDLPPVVLEAAIQGFEDASRATSMVAPEVIESDAGRLLAWHKEDRRAIPYLKRAIALAPDLYEAQYQMGVVAYGMKDFEEAFRRLREASRIQPEASMPHIHIGLSHLALGHLQEAIAEFRTAREKDPKMFWYFNLLGETLEKAGQHEEAEKQFLAAAHLNSKDVGAWVNLLAFYVRHQDLKGATSTCSKLAAVAPDNAYYREQCASLGLDLR